MKPKDTRTLVLMRYDADDEQAVFAGDLYRGNRVEDSVYLDRAAMLQWLAPIDARASQAAATAMDELLMQPEKLIRSIPVGSYAASVSA